MGSLANLPSWRILAAVTNSWEAVAKTHRRQSKLFSPLWAELSRKPCFPLMVSLCESISHACWSLLDILVGCIVSGITWDSDCLSPNSNAATSWSGCPSQPPGGGVHFHQCDIRRCLGKVPHKDAPAIGTLVCHHPVKPKPFEQGSNTRPACLVFQPPLGTWAELESCCGEGCFNPDSFCCTTPGVGPLTPRGVGG